MKFYRFGKYMWEASKWLPGIQLYTVKEDFESNPFRTLERVAEIGYKTIEFAGYGGIPAMEMKKKLDQLGLIAVATHVGIEDLDTSLKKHLEYASTIGIRFIVVPYIPKETLSDPVKYSALIDALRRIYEELRKKGFQLALHTHGHWFETINGKQMYLDRLLEDLGFKLPLEIDTYWVKKGGSDPETILLKYAGHVPLVHLKDMDQHGKTTAVGSGIINFRKIISQFKEVGFQFYFVEQEDFETIPFNDIRKSLLYLKSIGAA
ncbi:sugar phosphate isomerase/epimerase [Paenibacillus sp. LHD-38]|uniref:sugar phosphate isomerase/epimerase family protein n=1 Tax=Paenibacillus sp. LHD-38 TaxID=3072143 RepID=UPI00280C84C4|nr:sugar phosphate isomerase/epimerase [Paenibacillus sp. LHD-38]MDQ8739462.1 sugar phosphate isomerase/epimerase [Paenibacillus sp. LHD-38]